MFRVGTALAAVGGFCRIIGLVCVWGVTEGVLFDSVRISGFKGGKELATEVKSITRIRC